MKKTLITLTAITLVSCGFENSKKESFDNNIEIGKLIYQNVLYNSIKNDSVINFNKLDSIFEIRKNELSNELYNEK
jgi:hypothetical protein